MLKEDKGVQGQRSTTSMKIGKSRVHLQFPKGTHQQENVTVLLDHSLTDISNNPDLSDTSILDLFNGPLGVLGQLHLESFWFHQPVNLGATSSRDS
jgi:hypothetical protein